MSRIEQYVHQGLAHTGFAVLDPEIAATLRQDLWGAHGGMEASYEFAKAKNFLAGIQGVSRFMLRVKGRRDCPVMARGVTHLAQRIEWIIGQPVQELVQEGEMTGVTLPHIQPEKKAPALSDDRWHGFPTKESGRTCSTCQFVTAGYSCSKAAESGVTRPLVNVERRCLAFVPVHGSMDDRTGSQLWPELINLEATHGK